MCLLICYKLNRIQNSKMTSFQKIYNDSQVHNLFAWLTRLSGMGWVSRSSVVKGQKQIEKQGQFVQSEMQQGDHELQG